MTLTGQCQVTFTMHEYPRLQCRKNHVMAIFFIHVFIFIYNQCFIYGKCLVDSFLILRQHPLLLIYFFALTYYTILCLYSNGLVSLSFRCIKQFYLNAINPWNFKLCQQHLSVSCCVRMYYIHRVSFFLTHCHFIDSW